MADYSNKKVYFAASNSSDGFVSYFDEIFGANELDAVYIIKGGPGTGKSYFMNEIAKEAEETGLETEYFLCSSDTDSLDGVLFPEMKTAIIDGTSPHRVDPIYPGAVETILNFGAFFDVDNLKKHRAEIRAAVKEKALYYSKAYEYLSCAGTLRKVYSSFVLPAVDISKMSAAVKREAALYKEENGNKDTRIINSIGVHGEKRLDTFERYAKKIVYVKDCLSTAHLFLNALERALAEKKTDITVSYDPINKECIDAIFVRSEETAYIVTKECDKDDGRVINMQRFVNKKMLRSNSAKLRFIAKTSGGVKNEALRCLAEAGKIHAKTEELYVQSMDFEKKEKFTLEFKDKIFGKTK